MAPLFKKDPPPPAEILVEIRENGPLVVHGNVIIKDIHGNETRKADLAFFCRCGHSTKKPFCDGKHRQEGFIG
jgi:CDGSH-type Zn-finger protein